MAEALRRYLVAPGMEQARDWARQMIWHVNKRPAWGFPERSLLIVDVKVSNRGGVRVDDPVALELTLAECGTDEDWPAADFSALEEAEEQVNVHAS